MNETEIETMRHILRVQTFIDEFCIKLKQQAFLHDQSKLQPPELEIFDIYTPKLKTTTYGSDEYKKYLRQMKPALEHHYEHNRHHPEYFENGIHGMNLIDIVEMFFDWLAAIERHEDGNIYISIGINQSRFGFSNDLKDILKNTALLFRKAV